MTRPSPGPLVTILLVLLLLFAFAGPGEAISGSLRGNRVQTVATTGEVGVRDVDVKIVNCFGCNHAWESWGPSKLTLRCVDGSQSVSTVFPNRATIPRCIVESTLEIHEAIQAVLYWRAPPCDEPECGPWPPLP